MKRILFVLLMALVSSQLWSTESRNCMVCRNTDKLMNVAGHGCHTYLCSFCYWDNLESPTYRDVDGQHYWNYRCSHCGQTIRFYSTVEMEEYLPGILITHPSEIEGS